MSSILLKGGFEAGIFLTSCVFFNIWVNKRTTVNASKANRQVVQPTDFQRIMDPEESSRPYNIYPDEKIVVRFLH